MFKKRTVVNRCVTLGMLLLAGCSAAKVSIAAPSPKPAVKEQPTAATKIAPPPQLPTSIVLQKLPALHWQQRSDWINVKNDITPKAVGDGKADDTAAIQAAFDKVPSGGTVYFPPGTYRITETLEMIGKKDGLNLIGCGRDTRIVWDGAEKGKMLILNGLPDLMYRGIVLDGANKAAQGIWSFNTKAFETELLFEDSGFLHFTSAGIFSVPEGKRPEKDRFAMAETVYQNCLFADLNTGVYSFSFNDLNHTFTGCEFDRCRIGIRFSHGNFYIRDSHFEGGNINIWMQQAEHSSTLRRVTSEGAEAFLRYRSLVGALTMQDCHVANWTDPKGAVRLAVPSALMFDNTFSNANIETPVMEHRGKKPHRIVSNNTVSGLTKVLFSAKPDELITVPSTKPHSSGIKAATRFIKDAVQIPGKVFDAKDFGATGNSKADDTAAIQKTIDAAKAYGKNAIAYLPTGNYIISKTLNVTGANYYVGGSGYGTELIWKGAAGGTMVHVTSPQNITLENIGIGHNDFIKRFGNDNEATDILQSGAGKPSSIDYKRVLTYGRYMHNALKGFVFQGLGKGETVRFDEVQGNMHFVDCGRATILANVSYEGSVTISGNKGTPRDGFLGFMTRLATGVNFALIDKNNNNAVFSELYVEGADGGYNLSGDADDPPGRVTIESPKIDLSGKPDHMAAAKVFVLDNYAGEIFLGPGQFYIAPRQMRFDLEGKRKVDIYMIGNTFYMSAPEILQQSPSIKLHWLGSGSISNSLARQALVKTNVSKDDYSQIVPGLDDLRKLGMIDLTLNFPKAQ